MPLTRDQLLALNKVKAEAETKAVAAKAKANRHRHSDHCACRGKLGNLSWMPKGSPLKVKPELAELGITAANARGHGYFAVRATLDAVNHLNSSQSFRPGDRDYGVVKAKNGRTTTLPTKPTIKKVCPFGHIKENGKPCNGEEHLPQHMGGTYRQSPI